MVRSILTVHRLLPLLNRAGVTVFGTNSEANSLTVDELALLEALRNGGIPIGAGRSAGDRRCGAADQGPAAEAAAVLVPPPTTSRPATVLAYYSELVVGSPALRVVLYHIPLSGVPITPGPSSSCSRPIRRPSRHRDPRTTSATRSISAAFPAFMHAGSDEHCSRRGSSAEGYQRPSILPQLALRADRARPGRGRGGLTAVRRIFGPSDDCSAEGGGCPLWPRTSFAMPRCRSAAWPELGDALAGALERRRPAGLLSAGGAISG
jgi:hypothetical protein